MSSSKIDYTKLAEIGEQLCNGNIPQEVIDEVEAQIKIEHENHPKGLGYCHRFWARKKELLRQRGYLWMSQAELNPDIVYD